MRWTAIWSRPFVLVGLRSSRLWTPGLVGKSDDEHLVFATCHGFVLYTFNVSDFYQLHTEYLVAGREHAGMILSPQQRFSVGEQLRRILRLRAVTTIGDMRNQVEFLGNWG
jgi:hypothetical protein